MSETVCSRILCYYSCVRQKTEDLIVPYHTVEFLHLKTLNDYKIFSDKVTTVL